MRCFRVGGTEGEGFFCTKKSAYGLVAISILLTGSQLCARHRAFDCSVINFDWSEACQQKSILPKKKPFFLTGQPFLSHAGFPGAIPKVLVVYLPNEEGDGSSEIYSMQACNLVSHFGNWELCEVSNYEKGFYKNFTHVVFLGCNDEQELPAHFISDISSGEKPVFWLNGGISQILKRTHNPGHLKGWFAEEWSDSTVQTILYKGQSLERDEECDPVMGINISNNASHVTELAVAVDEEYGKKAWAIRAGNFYYLGDMPFAYVDMNDRYLAFADLLFDFFAPDTPTRHRALVRLEDVGPNSDPQMLRQIADALQERKVPFSVALYPCYRDPLGVMHGGEPTCYHLEDKPDMVDALQYMVKRGGTLLMHGYTHQYDNLRNPYSGVSAEDYEFFLAHVDKKTQNVIYDGPVSCDSEKWMEKRIKSGLEAFQQAQLPIPTIFEFPHYAGSALDYEMVKKHFKARYDRGLYFGGYSQGNLQNIDYSQYLDQFAPYLVHDVYGSPVIPENLGNVESTPINNNKPRTPEDILVSAKKNKVIRDGFASFFYHPFLGTEKLLRVVDGLKKEGWEFVSPESLLN